MTDLKDLSVDLTDTVYLLDSVARSLELRGVRADITVDDALACFDLLEDANRVLADVRRILGDRLGDLFDEKRHTVEGVATFERHARREGAVKCMDEDGLWRSVLDVRIVDPDTGEVVPQSEVIVMAYGSVSKETGKQRLTGATPTKVEVLGLDPEMFFEKGDRVGWTLRVHK